MRRTVVLLVEQVARHGHVHLDQVGHLPHNPRRTQHSLLLDVRVRRAHQLLHLTGQITRHLHRADAAQCRERECRDVLVRMIQVTEHTKQAFVNIQIELKVHAI